MLESHLSHHTLGSGAVLLCEGRGRVDLQCRGRGVGGPQRLKPQPHVSRRERCRGGRNHRLDDLEVLDKRIDGREWQTPALLTLFQEPGVCSVVIDPLDQCVNICVYSICQVFHIPIFISTISGSINTRRDVQERQSKRVQIRWHVRRHGRWLAVPHVRRTVRWCDHQSVQDTGRVPERQPKVRQECRIALLENVGRLNVQVCVACSIQPLQGTRQLPRRTQSVELRVHGSDFVVVLDLVKIVLCQGEEQPLGDVRHGASACVHVAGSEDVHAPHQVWVVHVQVDLGLGRRDAVVRAQVILRRLECFLRPVAGILDKVEFAVRPLP